MKLFKPLFILLVSTNAFSAGIPTFDLASITQMQLEAFENAKRWTDTLEQYKNQLKAQRDTLASQTGIRDIAGLITETSSYFNDAKQLQEWINNPKKILDLGFDSLSGELKNIYKSYGLNNLCDTSNTSNSELNIKNRKNCEGQIVLMTLRQQQTNNNLKSINERVETVNKIAKKMSVSKDQKESIDLNNAMNTQIALLQVEKLKMDLQVQQQKQQQELIEIQNEDIKREKMKMNKINNAGW